MSTYEETIWCCTTRRGIVDKKHDELKSFGRFWYQKIRDFLNSKHTVQGYSFQARSAARVPSFGYSEVHGIAPKNTMAHAQPLLVVGCLCRFGVCTRQGMGLGCAKGQ
jgi:hypothetical protein